MTSLRCRVIKLYIKYSVHILEIIGQVVLELQQITFWNFVRNQSHGHQASKQYVLKSQEVL